MNQFSKLIVAQELREYANREWAGMVRDLYRSRWQVYCSFINDRLKGIETPLPDYYSMEAAWTKDRSPFPVQPE
ncbi:MAG: alpha-N-acetylglucosaminidase C-terminal domain-containing protein [Lentimicrobium sp.]